MLECLVCVGDCGTVIAEPRVSHPTTCKRVRVFGIELDRRFKVDHRGLGEMQTSSQAHPRWTNNLPSRGLISGGYDH